MNNYPMMSMSDWERAPFNEQEIPEETFEMTCSQSLSKTATVTTENYVPGSYEDEPDTSDTNWAEEWHNNDHYTPLQLLGLFKECLRQMNSNGIVFKSPAFDSHLIKECEQWTEDDVEYMKND